MSKQQSFFLDKWEIFQKEHPERFSKKGSSRKKSVPKVYDCNLCGLDKKCRHPHIKRYGEGRKKILFVGMCPGADEDRKGILFVGKTGRSLRRVCELLDIDMDVDCVTTNVISCYPGKDNRGKDKKPTKDQIKCCYNNLEKDIQEVQPNLIICLGTSAIERVLQVSGSMKFNAGIVHGKVFPYHKYNCWVGCTYHPSFFLHRKNSDKYPDDENILAYDIARILNYLDEPLPQPLTSEGNECITDTEEAVAILENFCDSVKPVSFDYETNRLSPYYKDSKILSLSITNEIESASFIPLGLKDSAGIDIFTEEEQVRIILAMRNFLKSDAPKVVQNYNMEELWGKEIIRQPMVNFIHDTMVTAHVINCNPRTTGLAFQTFEMTGHIYKDMVDVIALEKEPLEKVCNYNCWDSRYTLMSYYYQKLRLGEMGENVIKFNKFFTHSLFVLGNFAHRGVPVDLVQLDKLDIEFNSGMKECKNLILNTSAANKFKEENEKELEITSPTQIGKVIYDICKLERTKKRETPSGKGGTSEPVLQEILSTTENSDVKTIISSLFTFRKNTKVIERITEYKRLVDPRGYVHPSFNLNIARSYRSSADGPNIQNVFRRDPEQRKFRKCIIPSPGNVWLEVDYDGLEVRVIAMVSGDLELIRQIIAGVDTHRKWAAKLFEKSEDQITKQERYRGKNEFVFPRFYGAVEDSIARSFPEKPKEHIVNVCREFWDEFKGVKEWQNRTISDYKQNGYIQLVTGAIRPGPLDINIILNTPIQGPAFHLLLDAADKIDTKMAQEKFRSLARFEVHDSLNFDTVPEEVEEVISLSEEILVSKRFEWQRNVPLSVSWEMGQNWYELEAL